MSNILVRQIKIKDETYDDLRDMGKMGETFDDVIRTLIEQHKKSIKK